VSAGELSPRAMTDEEFRLLRDLVHQHCGILVREEMKFLMERRLAARLEALGLSDFGSYYRYLRYDVNRAAELDMAVEAIATHETYFLRERDQLRAFIDELVPRLVQTNAATRRLRIWSAGCSTGEEPYTVAMLLLDCGAFKGWDVRVLGTDVSQRVLTLARRGEYGASALRVAPADFVDRHFEAVSPGRYRVREAPRAWVSFAQVNLMATSIAERVPRMDVVFCRNVLIYFDAGAKQTALKAFHDRLYDGGYLLLGHAENLIPVTADFELVHLQGDLVYRRPLGATVRP
jgi:chemotaxis protein methyltransferase CheR